MESDGSTETARRGVATGGELFQACLLGKPQPECAPVKQKARFISPLKPAVSARQPGQLAEMQRKGHAAKKEKKT